MNTLPPTTLYQRRRFPAEIISHCAWLYCRFCPSCRDVEALMAEGGIILTYEGVRYWRREFGQAYANQLQRRRPRPGDTWHLDEAFLTSHGERHDWVNGCPRYRNHAGSSKPHWKEAGPSH